MGRLAGRSALITGASSGIGRAIALAFAREGASVVSLDATPLDRNGGAPTVELIRQAGGEAEMVVGDVARAEDVARAVEMAWDLRSRLDVVVNNAAISVGRPLLDTTPADWDRVFAVNLRGVFLVCREAVARMLDQPLQAEVRGRIVNISSQHGMIAAPEDVAYGTSKSGVVYLTRQIAADYASDGIVCNAVAPGKIDTGPTDRSGQKRWQRYWRSRTPFPRLGRPEDVAGAAVFLASDEASFITGINLLVDGGWMAS
jgi:NAD(P)-dependent dehydrogenase (short-subunit alcohol dehydrogenase family)